MLQKYVYMYVHVCIQSFQNVEKLYRVESFESLKSCNCFKTVEDEGLTVLDVLESLEVLKL